MKQYVVLGGGITGLIIAYILGKSNNKVTIIEAGKEVGGLLSTFEVGGGQLEKFYHHFFTHDAEMMWLVKELNLEDKLIFHETSMGIYYDDKIQNFNSPMDVLKLKGLSAFDKIRFGLTSLYLGQFADWRKYENVSLYDWLLKYAGTNVTKIIWGPLLKVKFGSFYKVVPVTWMIGRLAQRLQSRKNGIEKLGYINGSLKVLLEAILKKLKELNVEVISNSPVTKINVANNKIIGLESTLKSFDDPEITYISTIPTTQLSKILSEPAPDYSKKLSEIKYFGAKCLIIESTKPLNKTYWLNIAEEGFDFGGIIQQTNIVDPKNYGGIYVTYLSRYFSFDEAIATKPEEQITSEMLSQVYKIFPNFTSTDVIKTHLFSTNTAATVCDLNFSKKVPQVKTPIDNLYICAMPHIYPDERSCNNSIRIAANCCQVLGIDTSYIPKGKSLSGLIGF